jgi:hypothetical protein
MVGIAVPDFRCLCLVRLEEGQTWMRLGCVKSVSSSFSSSIHIKCRMVVYDVTSSDLVVLVVLVVGEGSFRVRVGVVWCTARWYSDAELEVLLIRA